MKKEIESLHQQLADEKKKYSDQVYKEADSSERVKKAE